MWILRFYDISQKSLKSAAICWNCVGTFMFCGCKGSYESVTPLLSLRNPLRRKISLRPLEALDDVEEDLYGDLDNAVTAPVVQTKEDTSLAAVFDDDWSVGHWPAPFSELKWLRFSRLHKPVRVVSAHKELSGQVEIDKIREIEFHCEVDTVRISPVWSRAAISFCRCM